MSQNRNKIISQKNPNRNYDNRYMSFSQIAKALGLKEHQVKFILNNALQKIKPVLKQYNNI